MKYFENQEMYCNVIDVLLLYCGHQNVSAILVTISTAITLRTRVHLYLRLVCNTPQCYKTKQCLVKFPVLNNKNQIWIKVTKVNPLNVDLNPICHLLALLRVHHIPHVSRVRVKVIFIIQHGILTRYYVLNSVE
jgi:hypothetical protein